MAGKNGTLNFEDVRAGSGYVTKIMKGSAEIWGKLQAFSIVWVNSYLSDDCYVHSTSAFVKDGAIDLDVQRSGHDLRTRQQTVGAKDKDFIYIFSRDNDFGGVYKIDIATGNIIANSTDLFGNYFTNTAMKIETTKAGTGTVISLHTSANGFQLRDSTTLDVITQLDTLMGSVYFSDAKVSKGIIYTCDANDKTIHTFDALTGNPLATYVSVTATARSIAVYNKTASQTYVICGLYTSGDLVKIIDTTTNTLVEEIDINAGGGNSGGITDIGIEDNIVYGVTSGAYLFKFDADEIDAPSPPAIQVAPVSFPAGQPVSFQITPEAIVILDYSDNMLLYDKSTLTLIVTYAAGTDFAGGFTPKLSNYYLVQMRNNDPKNK